jgi:hypothetical protein
MLQQGQSGRMYMSILRNGGRSSSGSDSGEPNSPPPTPPPTSPVVTKPFSPSCSLLNGLEKKTQHNKFNEPTATTLIIIICCCDDAYLIIQLKIMKQCGILIKVKNSLGLDVLKVLHFWHFKLFVGGHSSIAK